jgi:4'-phosphopantetheinyl transferase
VTPATVFTAERADRDMYLREVLSACGAGDPAELRIARAPNGKPRLEQPGGDSLRFSLSHSGGLVAVAVARGREVGVDIQETRPVRGLQAIADRRFTTAEATELRRLDGDEQLALFHRLWVRKEAYLKATGEGLGGSLASFDALAPDLPGGWELTDLDVPDGYAGAVALAPGPDRGAAATADCHGSADREQQQ